MILHRNFSMRFDVIRGILNTSFTIEKDKTDRQYFGAPAVPADEVHCLPDNQHCFYKKPSIAG
jgi:hypothetical protein